MNKFVEVMNLLKSNDKYNNLIKYNKKDGILTLILFGIVIIMYSVIG